MNHLELIKKLIPGLAPLIVFVIADSIWGTEIGLVVAIAFGIIEIAISLVRKQKPDKFILFDIGLLVAMGGISLALENDLFFKLKPGVIGLIFSTILGVSAYGKQNIVMAMSKRYVNIEINEWQEQEFLKSIKTIFWLFLGHTKIVFVSAIYMSKETWVIVSGPGFYIVFGLFFAYEFLRKKKNRNKYSKEEWLPIVNNKGEVSGKVPRSIAHNGSKIIHPVVHLHVYNTKGELYLQKRQSHKLIQPNKWDTAVGGHVESGESIELALKREAIEEIGLKHFDANLLKQYLWESEVEKELVFVFVTITNQELEPNRIEIEEGKYWTKKEIEENLGKGVFTPNFEEEYDMLKHLDIL